MSDEAIMSDYLDALEVRLRARVRLQLAGASVGPRRSSRRRLAVVALGVGVAVAIAVVLLAHDTKAPPAFGAPLVLRSHPVDNREAQTIIDHLNHGITALMLFHGQVHFNEARPFPVTSGTAYLVTGDNGVCLSAPDPASPQPDLERGVTCTHRSDFLRHGIQLAVGLSYVAAVPQGVPTPTLTDADGTVTPLPPNAQGVVSLDLKSGQSVTIYGPDDKPAPQMMLP